MPTHIGTQLYCEWNWMNGTVLTKTVLAPYEFRTFVPSQTIALYDITAGADENVSRQTGLKDFTATFTYLVQVPDILANTLAVGRLGTLIYGESGTQTGMPKVSVSAFSSGPQKSYSHADITICTITFTSQGDHYQETVW